MSTDQGRVPKRGCGEKTPPPLTTTRWAAWGGLSYWFESPGGIIAKPSGGVGEVPQAGGVAVIEGEVAREHHVEGHPEGPQVNLGGAIDEGIVEDPGINSPALLK